MHVSNSEPHVAPSEQPMPFHQRLQVPISKENISYTTHHSKLDTRHSTHHHYLHLHNMSPRSQIYSNFLHSRYRLRGSRCRYLHSKWCQVGDSSLLRPNRRLYLRWGSIRLIDRRGWHLGSRLRRRTSICQHISCVL